MAQTYKAFQTASVRLHNDCYSVCNGSSSLYRCYYIFMPLTKKEKEQIKKEFLAKSRTIMVKGDGEPTELEEYVEQESWKRPTKPYEPKVFEKVEYVYNGDMGILDKKILFETDLWYMRNHAGFDLSVRNGRRVRR